MLRTTELNKRRRMEPSLRFLFNCWLIHVALLAVGGIGAIPTTVYGEETCTGVNGSCVEPTVDWIQSQIDWVRSKGGFVSSKVEIRLKDPTNALSYGMFAKQRIENAEMILSIPTSCTISAAVGDEQMADGMQCGTIRSLTREMKLGSQSVYAPYVNFLNSLPHGQVPSTWSTAGQDLLLELVGDELPPDDITSWIEDEWKRGCKGSSDPTHHQAAMLSVQRDWNGALVPLLELLNTRRGMFLNTKNNVFDDQKYEDDSVVLNASRPIAAGEEINTYYGEMTPNLLRDCGIVELYPQAWEFRHQHASFILNYKHSLPENDKIEVADLLLLWNSAPVTRPDFIDMFAVESARLKAFDKFHLVSRPDAVSAYEWKLIVDYHRALTLAVDSVLADVERRKDCLVSDGTCFPKRNRYSQLDEEFDDGFHDADTCDQPKELNHSHYEVLDTIQSHYQKIRFLRDPANTDMCFQLDGIFQQCNKYRPHYHEPVVHYAARFLEKITRVVFIGGGDSMLLHEALQYPTVELVVGLEIDQKVTRNSFKYFGTQPHWDDDRVQWWYRDAAKSLLMLPKDYFGTFDMVLVDLSETVMSNTVSKELDIMSALSLLLKPEGVFLKNEMYFKGLSKVFKHTIQLHYYDVPLVCSQCLVLGSNQIDFINTHLTDHKVKTRHTPVMEVDHDFVLVHDHMTNLDFERHCQEDNDESEPVVQERSPGVAMIVEAENASATLEPAETVRSAILPALEEQGLTVVSTKIVDPENKQPVVIVVLREGYVVARTWPGLKYCAFDIHMWSSFEKHEGAKKALLDAVGSSSDSSSAFRVAAGGMFGVSTWKDDDIRRGPKFTLDCASLDQSKGGTAALDDASAGVVLEDSMSFLLRGANVAVAVLCGGKANPCNSVDVLKKHGAFDDVIPLWTCQSLADGASNQRDINNLFMCEKEVFSILKDKKVGVVVVDPSAQLPMAQVVHKLTSSGPIRAQIFVEEVVAIAITFNAQEQWRRIFVDHFRESFSREPGFKSSAVFQGSNQEMHVATFSSGDKLFITHLKKAMLSIKARTGLTGEIRHVGGVEYQMQHNFKPTQFFNATDYDRKGGYKQWYSQQPTGYQNIIQLEMVKQVAISCDDVRKLLDRAVFVTRIDMEPEEFLNLGGGCVMIGAWSGGNVVVLYNGRDHLDINLFTFKEDFRFAVVFADAFTENSAFSVALRDEMPRGYGRVVNFRTEVEPREEPVWAFDMD